MQGNDRLMSKLPAARKAEFDRIRLLRGRLVDQPGSWLRLTAHDGRVEGVIWDGKELYAVTSYAEISSGLTTPLAVGPEQLVIVRMSDVHGAFPAGVCAVEAGEAGSPSTAADNYKSLVRELRTQVASAAPLGDQLEISLIADRAFELQTGGGANLDAEMMYRYNIVEGIFAEQVGVLILATDIRSTAGGLDPFTSTNAQTLLSQVATYRNSTPAVRQRGLAHLITGKDLDDNVGGIAYRDALCSATRGVSLSMSGIGLFGSTASALIMAHELGHNFGSPHDSDTTCWPSSYLMSPDYNDSGQFSSCSLVTIADAIARARGNCITPAMYADMSVDPIP